VITAGQLYEQIRADIEQHPDRRPVVVRLRELGSMHLCLRPGAGGPTHEDVDAVELMVRFLRAAKRPADRPAV